MIQALLRHRQPLFGLLRHQCSRSRLAEKRRKMFQGHRGANHPVKRLADGRVEITSMNHGFAVEREGLPRDSVRETHVAKLAVRREQLRDRADRPAGVLGPVPPRGDPGRWTFYLFEKFVGMMR